MWLKVVHRNLTKPHARAFSTVTQSAAPNDHDRLLRRVFRISRYYSRTCEDPIFALLNKLVRERGAMPSVYTLRRSGLTPRDFIPWKSIVYAHNLDAALSRLERRGIITLRPDISRIPSDSASVDLLQPPTWLVFYLLCYRVKHLQDAHSALALAYHHFPAAPPHLRPALLIFSACWFAEHDQLVQLDRLVKTFLDWSATAPVPESAFRVLLQLLAYASYSKDASVPAIAILKAVEERGLSLNQNTYDALLGSRFATAFLGLSIMRQMKTQNYKPTRKHLYRLIDLFAGDRWKRRAQICLSLLRQHWLEEVDGPTGAEVTAPDRDSGAIVSVQSENRYLSTLPSTSAVQSYLRQASKLSKLGPMENSLDNQSTVVETGATASMTHDDTSVGVEAPATAAPHDQRRPAVLLPPKSVAVRVSRSAGTWRSAVRVAANDRDVSSDQLLGVLQNARSYHPFLRSDIATHLFVIQGLLRRKDYANALLVWEEIRQHKDKFSRWAVAAGVEVLTLAGHPQEAMTLLQAVISATSSESGERARDMVDIQAINVFMSSLQRIGHSDVVFILWDNLELLFGLQPDHRTLTIVLKTARFASRSSPSFRGALTELGLGGLFNQPIADKSLSPDALRKEAFDRIHVVLTPGSPLTSTGLWKGERAGSVALRLTHEVLWSHWPELKDVRLPPARAIRPSADFQGFFPVADLFRSVMMRPVAEKDSEKDSAHDKPEKAASEPSPFAYSRILPNDVLFRTYIDVLATESQIPSIPRALAWMRHLDITPSPHTLATALIYWAEVSMDAPLVEGLKGGRSEYARLIDWMTEWVGSKYMPTDAHLGFQMQRLKHFRESSMRRPI